MSLQTEFALFDNPNIDILRSRSEDQWFDRKGIKIEATKLATHLIGFANADGGRIALGIVNGEIEGINAFPNQLNAIRQASIDFCLPPVRHTIHELECTNKNGQPDRILVLDIEASETIHRNQAKECYLRVGDETRRLGPKEEQELAFDKGESVFDKSLVPELTLEDLDMNAIRVYAQESGVVDPARIIRSRGLYVQGQTRQGVTQAGWLLFGKEPPIWCYSRYLHYAGTTVETGPRSNLVENIYMEGAIPQLIEQARTLIAEKIGTISRLTSSGKFETVPVLPTFAWLEAIVNAVTHRSYSVQGDGIRIRHFDDRIEVESPGRLPGLVRVQNIRTMRFSRNPHIARVLNEMGYVRELGEGINRMYEEMDLYGLRDPEFKPSDGSLRVILYNRPDTAKVAHEQEVIARLALLRKRLGADRLTLLLNTLKNRRQMPTRDVAQLLNTSTPTVRGYMKQLEGALLVTPSTKSQTDPTAQWVITESPLWDRDDIY